MPTRFGSWERNGTFSDLVKYGDLTEQTDNSLSEREDQSVQKILSGDCEDKGLNPLALNPATENQ